MLTDKEKLEEELKLLEESLHLEVITEEEYGQAKQRIERKFKALQKKEGTEESEAEEAATEEAKSEAEGEKAEEKESIKEKIRIREIKVEKAKSADEIAAEQVKKAAEEKAEEELVEKKEEAAEPKEKAVEEIEKAEAEIQKEEPEAEEAPKPEEEFGFEISKRSIKVIIYLIAILVLAFGSYFFFFTGNQETADEITGSSIFIACSSDDDCKREGYIGTCNNPGTEDAECAYIEDVKVKLFVLNDDSCFNCDTGRILSILNGFFPNLEIENLDIETSEGKEVADKFDIDALPGYILNSSLQQANNYHKLFNAFNKVGDSFVVKNTVSNANYYIQREEIPGKLDLIIQQNQAASSEAEKNLREFLDVFEGKVDFEKHGENSVIAKELGINTFPAFLLNNKIKFSGVQAADVIKYNFCRMNELDECNLELSKSLV